MGLFFDPEREGMKGKVTHPLHPLQGLSRPSLQNQASEAYPAFTPIS
jgi:hypothetical protein